MAQLETRVNLMVTTVTATYNTGFAEAYLCTYMQCTIHLYMKGITLGKTKWALHCDAILYSIVELVSRHLTPPPDDHILR
jgi:hypothetical protein